MTQKEIIALATDFELMHIMDEISFIHHNLVFKTVNEQKEAKQEMKHYAKLIIENLK